MVWTETHAALMAEAFVKVLGKPVQGTVAFARCLTSDVVASLAQDYAFAPKGWTVYRVKDDTDENSRTITADQAVELREAKAQAILLLVDTDLAGAGMDGIYSAAQEVVEVQLFKEAMSLAERAVTRAHSGAFRQNAELAIRRARGHGGRFSISPWIEFDYLVRVAAQQADPGALVYLLGLWPIEPDEAGTMADALQISRLFVERLLSGAAASLTPAQRINSLNLLNPTSEQRVDLELFLRSAAAQPQRIALEQLAERRHLWVNALRLESAADTVQGIQLRAWRTRTGRIEKWSGLVDGDKDDPTAPPYFILNPEAKHSQDYSKLEIRWKTRPDNLLKGAVQYQVRILTDQEEEITSRDVSHGGKKEEKCIFTNDDFLVLGEDALISAKAVVSVVGNDGIEPEESDEFTIKFGEPPDRESSSVSKKVRTFSEGLIELGDREYAATLAASTARLPEDNQGFVILRTEQQGKNFKVFRPSLIRQVEEQWFAQPDAVGRWRVKVRFSGEQVGPPEFVPMIASDTQSGSRGQSSRQRVSNATRRMAERLSVSSSVAQVYDERAKVFETVVKEYMLSWSALLEEDDPALALAHTVEVQSLSGRTIGLIVLPTHPLRIAWHVAYDNLVLYTVFEEKQSAKKVQEALKILDGAMFPTFLPGLTPDTTFVFADTLGFHAVGMVADNDMEPKAAVAILARALGENETADVVPTVGQQSAKILGKEIDKYINGHNKPKLLYIHALRPGDGFTVARALGQVQESYRHTRSEEDTAENDDIERPSVVLDLYPSVEQRGLTGRFIAETQAKRRRGAGTLAEQDRWMLESLSLPGGINRPLLRWARKEPQEPETPAHLAIAFDTFESRVVAADPISTNRPYFAYGLLSFFDRVYTQTPAPVWYSMASTPGKGEKHPSDRTHTERLIRLQKGIESCVAQHLGHRTQQPALKTEISPEKAESLQALHRLCDWVITLDRNAGVEYFDSPRENRSIYDAYVIDAVPEREDMGCLQLITSTSSLAEVRNLLDDTLDQMGLSHSRRNAEFLLENLKALSGRLAIRLTGQNAPNSELIALALSHANCLHSAEADNCWVSLADGFFVPVDDVLDLLPPAFMERTSAETNDSGHLSSSARPDLIYVSLVPRKGLSFRFIEVKYRRHLRASRSPDVLNAIQNQVQSLRARWNDWYAGEEEASMFRSLRRAKLARVLKFYADKAQRHHLVPESYTAIVAEIERMIERGSDYNFADSDGSDRGWIFCPEFAEAMPQCVTPVDQNPQIFLFGPNLLDGGRASVTVLQLSRIDEDTVDLAHVDSVPFSREPDAALQPSSIVARHQEDEVSDISRSFQDQKVVNEREPAICLGKDIFNNTEVRWPLTVKGNPHLLIAGLPGMGKTTCLLNLCTQMLDANVRPIVFSYHQDIDESLELRAGPVRFLDFDGLGFNPLQVTDRQSRMAYLDVAGALRDIFMAIYPELGDIQGERIRTALKQSFVEQGWADPVADLTTLAEPEFRRFVEILQADPKPDRGLHTLLVRLTELDDYGFFRTTTAQQSLWESPGAAVVRIHTTQNENLQRAFSSLIFYGLYKEMFRRGTQSHITHSIIFDEAHRAAKLQLLPTMAKECRKYGISLVVASQEAKDFNPSLFSAIANYLVLRLTEADAKALMRNVTSSDQERMLMDKVKQMDRFKALYFSEGKKKPSLIALLS